MKIVIAWEKGEWVVTFNGRITRFWEAQEAIDFAREAMAKIPREAP